jgi:hypothetical protein
VSIWQTWICLILSTGCVFFRHPTVSGHNSCQPLTLPLVSKYTTKVSFITLTVLS